MQSCKTSYYLLILVVILNDLLQNFSIEFIYLRCHRLSFISQRSFATTLFLVSLLPSEGATIISHATLYDLTFDID